MNYPIRRVKRIWIMAKVQKKLTTAQKRAKKKAKAERREKYQFVFINGKQVRIKRPPKIDGMDVDEFILNNADPIWLHQNEMWEYMEPERDVLVENIDECKEDLESGILNKNNQAENLNKNSESDVDIPF